MTQIKLTDVGAVSNARMIENGAMTAGQPTLTSASAPFTPGDVGKAIVVGGAGPTGIPGAKLKTTVAAYVSPTQLTLAANATTTISGAGVAWGTDCSAALLAALNQVDTQRGGEILVNGDFLLTEPVSKAFFSAVTTTYARILGSGTDSSIIIAVDSNEVAIALSAVTVDVERISFIGIPDAVADARRVLSFTACTASLLRCQLLGIATADQPVFFSDSYATLDGNMFGGTFVLTGGPAGSDRTVVYNVNWFSFEDRNSQFIDYGYWRGMLLSKSHISSTSGWVGLGTVTNTYLTSGARVAGIATFRGTRMDEGSLAGIWAQPATGTITSVELLGTGHNVSAIGASSGIRATSVKFVRVDRSTFGLATDSGTAFGRFDNCDRVEIDSVTLLQNVNKIVANNVDALIVRDTVIPQYALTGTNFFPERSTDDGFALIKSGPITDADFPAPPAPGTRAFDRLNGRLYLRARANWIWFVMDGGSLLGPELVPNGSGTSTAGWTPSNATLSSVGGALRVTLTAAYGRALESFEVEIGTTYVFSIVVVGGPAIVRVGRTVGGSEYVSTSTSTTATFTASGGTTLHISLIVNSETVGQFAEFKNISVRAS
ncbi:MAG: hypothetical protein ACXWUQ_12660 [Allosphingosinicella sp.]